MDFTSNQFLSGGLLLMVLGAALAYARAVPFTIYRYIKSRFIMTIEIESRDPAFDWVMSWLDNHPSSARSKNLIIKTVTNSSGEIEPRYSPIGKHWVFYNHRFVWFDRTREKQKTDNLIAMYETLVISTFSRRRGLIENIIKEAHQVSEDRKRDKVVIYSTSSYGDWYEIIRRKPRNIQSVILPTATVENTLTDIKKFLDSEAWYQGTGVPFRRGYLLHGPPGNGKTSLIFSIASELKKDLAILSLSGGDMTDKNLLDLMGHFPKDAILMVEDIDAAFEQRKSKGEKKLTFSGLLNALDGVASSEGRIMFMTTNHIDKLDPALIRPGRVDQQLFITYPQKSEVAKLFGKFFPNQLDEAKRFADKVTGEVSAAKLQEHFLRYRTASEAIEEWGQ